MLGMMQGKGGEQQVDGQQPMGAGLASLFANNAPASGGEMPTGMPGGMQPVPGLPQITQPQRPNIQMPMGRPIPQAPSVLPPAPGMQQTARQKQVANFSPRQQQWLDRRETNNR